MTNTASDDQLLPHPDDVAQAQPKRRPYNASASLSEYGIFPECDATPAAQVSFLSGEVIDAAVAPAKGAVDVADELADLASDMAYEDNQEMDQEKASRAAIIGRGERALRQLGDRQYRGGDVAAVLRQFLTGDGFIAECDIPHIVAALAPSEGAGDVVMKEVCPACGHQFECFHNPYINELRSGADRQQRGGDVVLGIRGSAFDPPTRCRAYTYAEQPGNVAASRLGGACAEAAKASAGDSIDRGLGLLKALQGRGFGVFELAALSATKGESNG